jgi:hypothetical protein
MLVTCLDFATIQLLSGPNVRQIRGDRLTDNQEVETSEILWTASVFGKKIQNVEKNVFREKHLSPAKLQGLMRTNILTLFRDEVRPKLKLCLSEIYGFEQILGLLVIESGILRRQIGTELEFFVRFWLT